jgi:hypothetical protein
MIVAGRHDTGTSPAAATAAFALSAFVFANLRETFVSFVVEDFSSVYPQC